MRAATRCAVVLAVAACTCLAQAQQNPLVGVWMAQGEGMQIRFEARADGTFSRSVKSLLGQQDSAGRYQVNNNVLVLQPQNGMPEQFLFQVQGNQLQVRDAMGNGFAMTRQAEAPAVGVGGAAKPAGQPVGGGPGGNTAGFKPALPLPKTPGGHIIYTRTTVRRIVVPGLPPQEAPLPDLCVMDADGGNKRPFLAPGDYATVKEARWSSDYKRLVFCSDWQLPLSACQQDIFVVNADGTGLRRVTGNALTGPAPQGYGAVTGVLRVPSPNPAEGELGINRSTVFISAQGGDGKAHHPGDAEDIDVLYKDTKQKAWTETQMRFYLPKVAAGNQVWIKLWRGRYEGSVVMVQVKPNTINDIGQIELNQGTFHAFRPTLGPNPQYLVGMGSLAGKARNVPSVIEGGGKHDEISGSDSMTVYDFKTGTFLASLDPLKMNMHVPKDPVISPDGQLVACAWGQPSTESLAVIPLADLAAMRPSFRVLAKGEMILPNAVTTFQANNVSYSSPAWSPDGRTLCCSRTVLSSNLLSGELCLVGADGSGGKQLTRVGQNALAGQPCFSPDGKQVAFTVVTGRNGSLTIEDMMLLNIRADVYCLDLASGKLTQLTNDGASGEPAWGP